MSKSIRLFKTLLILLIFLVIINIFFEILFTKIQTNLTTEISINEIQNIFLESLKNFSISDTLIVKINNAKHLHFLVKIYNDLPIDIVLLELERNFFNKNVRILTKDSINNRLSICKIYLHDKLALIAELTFSENLFRNKGSISFFIKARNAKFINENILQTTEPISLLIIPDNSFYKNLRQYKEYQKNYFILISDEIEDLMYKFGKEYSVLQTKNSLYNILRDFEHSGKIFIDNKNLESQTIKIIENQLKRNNISVLYLQDFVDLTEKEKDIEEEFLNIVYNMKNKEIKRFIISSEQYSNIHKIFPSLRKIGYKIIP